MSKVGRYFYNLAYSLDQMLNTVWGGDPDETVSSRIGRAARDGYLRPVPRLIRNVLERIDRNHCAEAIEEDEGARAIADRGRCDRAIVESGSVIRCRRAAGHLGPHRGRLGEGKRVRRFTWGRD